MVLKASISSQKRLARIISSELGVPKREAVEFSRAQVVNGTHLASEVADAQTSSLQATLATESSRIQMEINSQASS